MRRDVARNRTKPNAERRLALPKLTGHVHPNSKRMRGPGATDQGPFLPPEDWYEPAEEHSRDFRVIVQSPGRGFRHAVTADEVRERLAQLPAWMIRPLEVVQLSRMTRKKKTFPCYGMQWGCTLYLYPIEDHLVEEFSRAPKPAVYNESKMYGGRWKQHSQGGWHLIWTPSTLRDFYLNNILIHELGHLLDDRNASYIDRERYAEWFALEHGYKPSQRARLASQAVRRRIKRRHHAT